MDDVAEDSVDCAVEEVTEDATEEATDVVAEDVAEVVAESAIEDEKIAKSSPDETVSDVSLEDTSTTAEGESPEQLQTNPAVKTVTAKTPEECLYIGTSGEQNHNPF